MSSRGRCRALTAVPCRSAGSTSISRGGLVASVYELVRNSARARDAAVDALVDAYFVDADPEGLLDELGLLGEPSEAKVSIVEKDFADRAARYKDLCERADIYWSDGRGSRHEARLSARLRRSAAARDAVLLRSRGHCENPRCTGDVQDVTDRGAPILEVDHVRDLAKGGPDKPDLMIALRPTATRPRPGAGRASRCNGNFSSLPDGVTWFI